MKTDQINLRTSAEDKQLLEKAANKLQKETGRKPMTSRVILKSLEEYANQPPEMYYCDRTSIRQIDVNVEYGRLHMENVISDFKKLTGEILTLQELEVMFVDRRALGSGQIIKNAISECVAKKLYDQLKRDYPGMPVNIDTVLDDKDLSDLFKAGDDLTKIPEIGMQDVIYYQCYKIGPVGEITVLTDQVERIKDNYRATANSPLELQRLAKIRSLCEMLNSFLTDKDFLPEQIPALFYFDRESARFEPTGAYIKNFSPPVLLD